MAHVDLRSVQWAELETIDLANAQTPEGQAEEVRKIRDAMHKQGFCYIINHGLEQSEVRTSSILVELVGGISQGSDTISHYIDRQNLRYGCRSFP